MQRCPVCQGRTIKTELGYRCMKADCEGTAQMSARPGIECSCGEMMEYGHLNSYGDTVYYCTTCGAKNRV